MPAPVIKRLRILPTLSVSAEIEPPADITVTSYKVIITPDGEAAQTFNTVAFKRQTNLLDCITRVGLCVRGDDVEISIAANHAGGTTDAAVKTVPATPNTSAIETIRQRLAERIGAAGIAYTADPEDAPTTLHIFLDRFGRPASAPKDRIRTNLPNCEIAIPTFVASTDLNTVAQDNAIPIIIRAAMPAGDIDEGARAIQAITEQIVAALADQGLGLTSFGIPEGTWQFTAGTPVESLQDNRVAEARCTIALPRHSEPGATLY